MKKKENKEILGLCFRCEHRIKYLEEHFKLKQKVRMALIKNEHLKNAYIPCPRCECGMVESQVCSCYLYKPVRPHIINRSGSELSLHGNTRPIAGAAMISGRVSSQGVWEGKPTMKKCKKGYLIYYA